MEVLLRIHDLSFVLEGVDEGISDDIRILVRSGGPPAAASITSADSRKYCGPITAGVIAQSAFTFRLPSLLIR
jgi:hypothetical protein